MWDAIATLFGSVRDFLRTWPRLLAADVAFKLLAFALLTPLVGYALRRFVALSGNVVVADQDILRFVLSPIGMVALVIVAAATIAIVALEQAGLMTIGFGAVRGTRVGVSEALSVSLGRAWSVLLLTASFVVRVLALAAPFLAAAGLVYWLLLTEFDINYYLSERPSSFWIAAILIGGIVVAMLAVVVPRLVGWAFALPLHLFEDVGAFEALRVSEERTGGHRASLTVVLVGWATLAVLLSAATVALVRSVGIYLVPRFQESLASLLFVLGGVVVVWGVVNLFVTLFQAATFALLTVRLYDRQAASESAVVPGEATGDTPGGWLSLKTILSAVVVVALAAGVLSAFMLRDVRTEDDVLVIAHRGAAGRAPENTLASIDAALEDGADIVEIDVQETRDGRVVVLHDSDFMKIGRVGTKIWDASYDEIRDIDIGSWFGPEFSDQRIVSLEDVLYRCKGRARVDIELKYYGHDQRLEERVVEIVERTGMVSDVIVMSLAQSGIRKMRELRPNWTLGLLMAKTLGNPAELDADFLAVHTGIATRRFIRRAHAAGKEVYVWTANDPITMSRMMSRGVDGIITDEPARLNRVLEQRAALSSVERLLLEAALWMGVVPKDPQPEVDAPGEAAPEPPTES